MPRPIIIIPAYNEAEYIGGVVREVIQAQSDFDVVVIDDGSNDDTADVARRAGATVARHPFNLGYGVALQTGYRLAVRLGCPLSVQIDGDGQHNPADINALVAPIVEGRADAVYGTRFHDRSVYRMPLFRRLGSRWFSLLLHWLTGLRVSDPTTGMQALSREVLALYDRGLFPNDYPDADMIVFLHRNRFRVVEVPVSMRERPVNESMHQGLAVLYYIYKMTLAVGMNRIRKRQRGTSP